MKKRVRIRKLLSHAWDWSFLKQIIITLVAYIYTTSRYVPPRGRLELPKIEDHQTCSPLLT